MPTGRRGAGPSAGSAQSDEGLPCHLELVPLDLDLVGGLEPSPGLKPSRGGVVMHCWHANWVMAQS